MTASPIPSSDDVTLKLYTVNFNRGNGQGISTKI
jgi:hypothetical protein